jgi:hypothetical protein
VSIFEQAQKLVDGNRQNDYGTPQKNWSDIAKVWSGILGFDVTAEKAALCMVGLKCVREAYKHKEDNIIDAIGYLDITDRIVNSNKVTPEQIKKAKERIKKPTNLNSDLIKLARDNFSNVSKMEYPEFDGDDAA